MRNLSLIGNSLAYLLRQNKARATSRRTQMRKASLIGNSLAYLLRQEQKRATANVRVVSKQEA
jgi:hypothetical protein